MIDLDLGGQIVTDLSDSEKKALREYCTRDNPKYAQAMRYSKWSYTKIPRMLHYYSTLKDEGKEALFIPVGINVPEVIGRRMRVCDNRVSVEVEYPDVKIKLRKEQKDAFDSYMRAQDSGYPFKSLVHLPTGKGKTILGLFLASKLKQKTLVLVHKSDLVVGWQKDCKLVFGEDFKPGLIKAQSKKVGEQITIATVQTLNKMAKEDLEKLYNEFGFVIQDEFHHIGATIFEVIGRFNSKYKLGLSATPMRSDGLDFAFEFFLGGLCYEYEYKEGDDDILDAEVIVKRLSYRYEPVQIDGEIYNYYSENNEVRRIIDNASKYTLLRDIDYEKRPRVNYLSMIDDMCRATSYANRVCNDVFREYSEGHSILVLFTHKEHCEIYGNALKKKIDPNDIILYYGDSKEKDEVLLSKVENKRATITLATYAKATEGTNVKQWEVLFLVGSLNNKKNVEQAVGRIRRKTSDVEKLERVRIYDYWSPESYSLSRHYYTRKEVYDKLKFSVTI